MVIIYTVTKIGGFYMWYYLILLILIVLLFIPIRMRIKVIYENQKVSLYIFNKEIKKKAVKEPHRTKKIILKKKLIDRFQPKNLRSTISTINNNNYKPYIRLACELNYGFDDAAVTGLSYGIFNSFSFILYKLVKLPFSIKDYKFTLIPHFNNTLLNINATCIISFNIAKIIYMLLIILKSEEV